MKRSVLKISLFLLLGAIVNVAVAWGCATWEPDATDDFACSLLPPTHIWPLRSVVRHGFPCHAMELETRITSRMVMESSGAFQVPEALARPGHGLLPLRPIWPGFAINTVAYAALLWLAVNGVAAVRRWRRAKRGLCPACAYPIGASAVCTECGTPVPGIA